MKLILLLSGENVELAREEVKAVLKPKNIKQDGRILIIETNKRSFKRLAYTRKVFKYLFQSERKNLEKQIKSFNWNKIYKKNFGVTTTNLTNKKLNPRPLANIIHSILHKPKVNLSNPKTNIHFISSKKTYAALLLHENTERFSQRKAHLRPQLSPVSLDPKLARACINLTGIKPGQTLLDPFVGTAGILIEAAKLGCKITGFDIDSVMLNKAKINLKHFKIKSFNLRLKDATKIKRKFNYIVTDLPYAKSSKISKPLQVLYKDFLKNLKIILKQKAVIVFPDNINHKKLIKQAKLKINKEFDYYLHKSLSKKIVLLST